MKHSRTELIADLNLVEYLVFVEKTYYRIESSALESGSSFESKRDRINNDSAQDAYVRPLTKYLAGVRLY
jgi:hypothetical protein